MAKLAEPYSVQHHKGAPAYVLYLSRRYRDDPDGNQVAVFIYAAPYAAKRALELILADDGIVWVTDNHLKSESGIEVQVRPCRTTTHTLKELWEYEYTIAEMAWEMQPPYSTECKRFRLERVSEQVPEKVQRKRGNGPRASRAGMTPIADIALELGITAREARGAFRKARIPKPPCGWAFKPDEVDGIRAKLKEVLGL